MDKNVESIEFTREENQLITLYIHRHRSWFDTLFHYGAYILPSFIFAIYAILKGDFVAAIVAYVALFVMAVLYLSYSGRCSRILRSILVKYDLLYSQEKTEKQSRTLTSKSCRLLSFTRTRLRCAAYLVVRLV